MLYSEISMNEDNPVNQGALEKQKLEQLKNEVENIGNKTTQETPSQPEPVQQQSVPQPSSSVSSVEPKPQGLGRSKGILWIGIALLVLALVGVGAYFLGSRKTATTVTPEPVLTQIPTPTPDSTANWKIYTTREYGYSVKYPPDWEVVEAKPPNTPDWTHNTLQENQLHEVTFFKERTDLKIWPSNFIISVNKNPNNFDTESWALNYFVPLMTDPTENLAEPKGKISMDSNTAYKFSVFQFDANRAEIGLVKNGNIYVFSFVDDTPNDQNLEKNKEIYDQILSTFEFIEASPEIIPTDFPSATITP